MNDELDDELDIDDSSFDDFEQNNRTLGDIWRETPLLKVGAVVAAVVVVLGGVIFLGAPEDTPDPSVVPSGSTVNAPPGTEEVSPVYMQAVEEESERRVEQAYREGGSALPTPIDPPVGRLSVPEEEAQQEDPLQRWRRLQEERLQRELQQARVTDAREGPGGFSESGGGANPEAVKALAETMSKQMQMVLETKADAPGMESMEVTSPKYLEELRIAREAALDEEEEDRKGGGSGSGSKDTEEVVIFPAGEIAYAQLLTEANSDVPGPVLAQIASGPLAGSRVLGSFEVQKELLTLTFDTIVIDGKSQSINAIALDPGTTLPGMATEVDHRYLQRVVLPMAAAFVEGAADAISDAGLTTVSVEGSTVVEDKEEKSTREEVASGISEAGKELGDIFDDMANEIEVLVKIDSGTPLGILFLDPVTEPLEVGEAEN